MPKRLIIAVSIVAVIAGAAIFAIVVIRSRSLSGTIFPPSVPPSGQVSQEGGELAEGTSGIVPDEVWQDGPCGDGVCSEGESWCRSDCGNEEDRFLGSIKSTTTPTSITITWRTDEPSTGEVNYGRTERYELGSISSSTPATSHSVELRGLSPGTEYHVLLRVTGSGGQVREVGPMFYETPGA